MKISLENTAGAGARKMQDNVIDDRLGLKSDLQKQALHDQTTAKLENAFNPVNQSM